MNHYQTLGLSTDATPDEIKARYRILAMQWHPDRHQSVKDRDVATEKFKCIQQAYSILGDPDKRSEYDDARGFSDSSRPEQPGGHQEQQYWWEKSSGFQHQETSSDRFKGKDVTWKTKVTLADAINGCEVIYTRKYKVVCSGCDGEGKCQYQCPTCHGKRYTTHPFTQRQSKCDTCWSHGVVHAKCDECKGRKTVTEVSKHRIRLPANLTDGVEILAKGLGTASEYAGRSPGDLIIVISIKAEKGFTFVGSDIVGTIKVSFTTALLGGPSLVDLPNGKQIEVKIPARTDSGKKLRISEMGLSDRRGKKGDLVLTVRIVLPKSRRKLTPAEEAFLRSLEF